MAEHEWEALRRRWRDAGLGDEPPEWLREYPDQIHVVLDGLRSTFPDEEPPSYRSEVRELLEAARKKEGT